MKMIQNKNLIQKILLLLLVVLCLNFVCPTKSHAGLVEDVGGALLSPIADLLVGLGDAVVAVSHDLVVYDTSKDASGDKMDVDTLWEVDLRSNVWQWVAGIAAAILAVIVIVGLSIVTAGIAGAAIGVGFSAGAIGAISAGTIITGFVGGALAGGAAYHAVALGNHYYLPVYTLSPEEIFQNKLPLFNVNFFNPNSNKDQYDMSSSTWVDVTNKEIFEIFNELETKKETAEDGVETENYYFSFEGQKYKIIHRPDTGNMRYKPM